MRGQFSLQILFGGIFYFILLFGLVFLSARTVLVAAPFYRPSEPISIWYFLVMFALVTAGMVFFLRRIKSRLPFEVMLTLAIFAGLWFLADIWFEVELAIAVAIGLMALKYVYKKIWWQNLILVFGIAGISVSVGLSLPWISVIIIMLILSVYDVVAVYFTRHMVEMFKGLIKKGIIFALILPARVRLYNKTMQKAEPGGDYLFLGTGDLALPAIFVGSLMPADIFLALGASAGALLGFAVMQILFFSQSKKRPMPALPPIAGGALIGFGIVYLLIF